MAPLPHKALGLATGLLLTSGAAAAQTIQDVVSAGDPFLNFTVVDFRDIAPRDNGDWFAAVSTFPAQGSSLSIIRNVNGVDGVATPGFVSGLPGVLSTLLHFPLQGDFSQTGTQILVSNVSHGLLVGEAVELHFSIPPPGVPPTAGVFTVQSVIDALTFTVTHGTPGNCGSPIAPCGKAVFVRTIQSSDLHVSTTCLPALQGVLQLQDDDDPLTPPVITPNQFDTGLFWNSVMLLREGQVSNSPQVGAGTVYSRIWRSTVDSRQDYYVLTRMNDPLVPGSENALVKIDVSPDCPPAIVSEQVLLRSGDVIQNTGNDRFASFKGLEQRSFDANERGDYIILANLTDSSGLPSAVGRVVVNGRAVLSEFSQVPGGARQMVQFGMASVDMNDLGDYVMQVKLLDGGPPQAPKYGEAIVKKHVNGGPATLVVQSGDPVPDPAFATNGEILLKVGKDLELIQPLRAFPALITNGGDVIWYGEWAAVGPEGQLSHEGIGIFFNNKVVALRGQTYSSDGVLKEIGNSSEEHATEMEVSANGRYLFFEGVRGKVSDPSFSALSLFRIDLGESVPYGTVVQSTGGGGCPYPYPGATLDCTPGLPLPGSSTFGDFPLIGHQLQAVATGAPPLTTVATFMFTVDPPATFPCGFFAPGLPFPILLGPTLFGSTAMAYGGSFALYSAPIPNTLSLIGTDWYSQTFFQNGSVVQGATNAIRFVFGAF